MDKRESRNNRAVMGTQIHARCTQLLRDMASARMKELGFSSDSEYIRHLVIQDNEKAKAGREK